MPDWSVLAVAWPAIVAGYTVFGTVGFGTTLVAMPIIVHVIPLATLAPAVAVTDLLAAAGSGLRMSKNVVRHELLRLLPPIVLGSAAGTWILLTAPVQALMLALGVFVFLYALNGFRSRAPAGPVAPRWAWWYGTTGGVLSSMFGAGGWVYAIYLLRRLDDPAQVRATQSVVLLFTAIIRVSLFAIAGRYFDAHILWLAAALVPGMAIGVYLGHRIAQRLHDRARFMRTLFGVLLFTGASLVLRAVL